MKYQYKLKTFHFNIGPEHVLFRARNYENALKQLDNYVKRLAIPPFVIMYLGYSYGVFGKIHHNEK